SASALDLIFVTVRPLILATIIGLALDTSLAHTLFRGFVRVPALGVIDTFGGVIRVPSVCVRHTLRDSVPDPRPVCSRKLRECGGHQDHEVRVRGQDYEDRSDRRTRLAAHRNERTQASQVRSETLKIARNLPPELDPELENAHDRGTVCTARGGTVSALHERAQRAVRAEHDVGSDALGGRGLPLAADERGGAETGAAAALAVGYLGEDLAEEFGWEAQAFFGRGQRGSFAAAFCGCVDADLGGWGQHGGVLLRDRGGT
ncbi:hypothetical protein BDK51DRAFT_51374, partial [Blyttiomyces helicus]